MQVTENDKQLTETMIRDFLDIQMTHGDKQGDVVEHVQQFKNEFRDNLVALLQQSFNYVADNAEEEARQRGADDPRKVRVALLANITQVICNIAAEMTLTELLTLGVGGVVSVTQGKISNEQVKETVDEILQDVTEYARANAHEGAEKILDETKTLTELLKKAEQPSEIH